MEEKALIVVRKNGIEIARIDKNDIYSMEEGLKKFFEENLNPTKAIIKGDSKARIVDIELDQNNEELFDNWHKKKKDEFLKKYERAKKEEKIIAEAKPVIDSIEAAKDKRVQEIQEDTYFEYLMECASEIFGSIGKRNMEDFYACDCPIAINYAKGNTNGAIARIGKTDRFREIYAVAESLAPSAHHKWLAAHRATCGDLAAYKRKIQIDLPWDQLDEEIKNENIQDLFLTLTLVIEPLMIKGVIDPKKRITKDQKQLMGMLEHIKWSMGFWNMTDEQLHENLDEIYNICGDNTKDTKAKIEALSKKFNQYNLNPLQGKNLFLFEEKYNFESVEDIQSAIEISEEEESSPKEERKSEEENSPEKKYNNSAKADAARIYTFLALKQMANSGELSEETKNIKIYVREDETGDLVQKNIFELTLRDFPRILSNTKPKKGKSEEETDQFILDNFYNEIFNKMSDGEKEIFAKTLPKMDKSFRKTIMNTREKSNIGFGIVKVEQKKDGDKADTLTKPIGLVLRDKLRKLEAFMRKTVIFPNPLESRNRQDEILYGDYSIEKIMKNPEGLIGKRIEEIINLKQEYDNEMERLEAEKTLEMNTDELQEDEKVFDKYAQRFIGVYSEFKNKIGLSGENLNRLWKIMISSEDSKYNFNNLLLIDNGDYQVYVDASVEGDNITIDRLRIENKEGQMVYATSIKSDKDDDNLADIRRLRLNRFNSGNLEH